MTEMEVLLSQMGEPPAEAMDLEAHKNPPSQPSFRERTGLEACTGVAGAGPYVAWLALRNAPEADDSRIRNPSFLALWMDVLDCSLTILGPV
jgi:hypothetical protein